MDTTDSLIATDHARRGSALMVAMVLIITLTALTVSMTNVTVMGVNEQVKRYDKVSLLLSAESAVNLAISDLQQNYASRVATELPADKNPASPFHSPDEKDWTFEPDLEALFGAGTLNGVQLDARITRLNTDASDPDLIAYLVEGTATVGEPDDPMTYRRTRVECTLMPAPQTSFKQAMLAVEGYSFQGAATTDSWDSSVDHFGSGAGNGNEGDLASEGDINVQKPDNVNGEVIDNSDFPLPRFDYDDQLAAAGSLTLINPSGGAPGILDDGYVTSQPAKTLILKEADSPYHASEVALSGTGTVRVEGAVELYVDGSINVSGSKTTLFIDYQDSASRLKIYQRDYSDSSTTDSSWDNNGGILGSATPAPGNKNNDPKYFAYPDQLMIMTEYQGNFKMNGNGVFSGVFFAPWATVRFNGTFNFFGSIIAKSFDNQVNGTFNFHYDENLANLDLDLTARLVMVGWRTFDLGYNYSD